MLDAEHVARQIVSGGPSATPKTADVERDSVEIEPGLFEIRGGAAHADTSDISAR
ncbi:hypothetical protein FRACA_1470001 [Frankia canadensis]|uniref:Uncharacterized protein n=1 Tax=Frankia canadensis TaxID=1836972 RepID=A0A2I2KLP3_9ACTN|nr:hypothetical protein FRACA_1470001 [Frankia canadensis]SOU53874.1 hypothetical protein FRACA_1470001 [Frankia canadensis]